jgi:hypothetical protein
MATQQSLTDQTARQLACTTKTPPQMESITPRWLVRFLPWVPVFAGIYRINRVKTGTKPDVACGRVDESEIPRNFVDYEDKPIERTLSMVSTIVDVHTRISDLFSNPMDQIREQLRITIEAVKEKQELELINNKTYGLLANVVEKQRVATRKGPPTPDDMDELISRVWKEPAFFLAHPRAIAAFGRECTRRGVPPPTVTIFGSPFLTWRGLPLIPSDKMPIDAKNTTSILLLRTGAEKQGVSGLFQPNLPGEQTPGLSVRFMGIDSKAMASYLISLYCSAAVHVDDALGCLEGVEIGKFHEYA